jgi:hypothetical protein
VASALESSLVIKILHFFRLLLIDAVKNRKMENDKARFVEQKFNVNIVDVLIRSLGYAFSAQLRVA